jgi:hypothetical protein
LIFEAFSQADSSTTPNTAARLGADHSGKLVKLMGGVSGWKASREGSTSISRAHGLHGGEISCPPRQSTKARGYWWTTPPTAASSLKCSATGA